MQCHTGRLDQFLGRVLGNVHSAEDVRQDTWSSLWTHREQLRDVDPWPYIRAVGLRKAIDRMRGEKCRPKAGIEFSEPLAARTLTHGLQDELARLGRDERAVLVLFFWEGLSVREIADLLEVPPGTVKTWMFRARRRMKGFLEKERGE
ncbi:MAG: RNA polymerase sigma factor [Planctomycetota bacterium]